MGKTWQWEVVGREPCWVKVGQAQPHLGEQRREEGLQGRLQLLG